MEARTVMTMAAVWIAPLGDEPLEPQRIQALIEGHVTPADRVEHLRTRAGPEGVVVFGFLMAGTAEQARTTLRTLVRKTLASEPELRSWRVI